jgi:hypothetical protein
MSLDLFVLTPANAATLEQAISICAGDRRGIRDDSGELEAYATEVYDAYTDDDWPFAGDPIVDDAWVLLTVAPDAWSREVPRLVERAHLRGLVALDSRWGGEAKLFPPGEPYPVD